MPYSTLLPMKMEPIEGSETSAFINQTPGNYPKGNLLYSVHGESLKSRLLNLLSPWSTVLLKKLTGLQLVKKCPAFYGTRRFITALASARHLSLSWATSIQSIPPHPTDPS